MAWTRPRIIILISILALVCTGAYFAYNWPNLTINPQLSSDAYNILLKYIFIIMVCERSVAVYNAINYDGRKLAIERRIKYFREKMRNFTKMDATAQATYEDDDPLFKGMQAKRPTNSPDINYLNLIELEEEKLEEVGEKKRNFSMRVLMIAGALLAIGGLSVLNDLIVISAEWRSAAGLFQERLIKFFDILLTGALIGGGSKSFHTLLSTVGEVLKRVKSGPKSE